MASILLRVLVLAVIAAAADDVPVTWVAAPRVALPCAPGGAGAGTARTRRPPPPLTTEEHAPAAPRHAWWRGDEPISAKRILPNGTLEVSRKRDGDGMYRCSVRQDAGTVLGTPTHVKFATIEKEFSVSPRDTKAFVGQPVALSCHVQSGPPATVSWLKDDQPLPQDDRYHFLPNQLLIMDVRMEDDGLYKCIAKNALLNKSRVSAAGRIEVVQETEDLEPDFLTLELETNITAVRESRVELPCPVVGRPRPKLIWYWTPPGARTAELEFTGEVLTLSSLLDPEGVYTCTVEDDTSLSRTFNVTIQEPVIITIPPTPKEALRAGTVRFNCTAEGKPAPNITWYKDGQQLIMAGRINLRQSTSDGKRTELVISGVTSDDAGIYQCFASNGHSVATAWTTLNVTGADAAAPGAVRCWPEGAQAVRVSWAQPAAKRVVAYTVHATPQVTELGRSLPGLPHTNTEELVILKQPLTPYSFQVRAYIQPTSNNKNVASDLSDSVTCQGQGVPIKLVKLDEDSVLVSWKQFAGDNPDVAGWVLQYRQENGSHEHNVTLDRAVYNYTMNVSPESPLQIRVLGSKTTPWLDQDLSLVPWASTAAAGDDLDTGDAPPIPQDLEAKSIGARNITVAWQCDEASTERYIYMVCVRKLDGNDECKETNKNTMTFSGLQPGSPIEVRVRARVPGRSVAGGFSDPLVLTTRPEGSLRFMNLTSQHINTSALRVTWSGEPAQYTVHYSAQLRLPVEQWDSVETRGNTVLINGINPTETTYVMVTGYNPVEHSKIETIPPLYKDLEPKDIHYEYTSSGVRVWWTGLGPRLVSYAQNITQPVEQWRSVNVETATVELTDLNPYLATFVMVTAGKKRRSQVLTIEPRPQPVNYSTLYIGLGIAFGVILLVLLAFAAVFIWRKRKRARSPVRSRRRVTSDTDGNEEEGSEMKNIGGRLANGGSKEAGEPLLNGHVHITENPTSKTPNGKMRKPRRYEPTFDVSRHEDPDATLDTVLDSETSFNLLDTSRRPDNSRSSENISTNNSFTKLPDDNMNSELTSTFELDDSKIQPTLQPNG